MNTRGWLCSVDVGLEYHAEAWFKDGALQLAILVRDVEPINPLNMNESWDLFIESATVRARDGHTKKREVDALNRAAGRLGAHHPDPQFRLPEAWKGNVPKRIDHERTVKLLTDAELFALKGMKKNQLVHLLDAIGFGLRVLGRR